MTYEYEGEDRRSPERLSDSQWNIMRRNMECILDEMKELEDTTTAMRERLEERHAESDVLEEKKEPPKPNGAIKKGLFKRIVNGQWK